MHYFAFIALLQEIPQHICFHSFVLAEMVQDDTMDPFPPWRISSELSSEELNHQVPIHSQLHHVFNPRTSCSCIFNMHLSRVLPRQICFFYSFVLYSEELNHQVPIHSQLHHVLNPRTSCSCILNMHLSRVLPRQICCFYSFVLSVCLNISSAAGSPMVL